jgi:hypothetical protein
MKKIIVVPLIKIWRLKIEEKNSSRPLRSVWNSSHPADSQTL